MGLPIADVDGTSCRLYEDVDYSRYWWRNDRSRRDHLERAVVRTMLPCRGRRLIDVGCGFGRLAECYQHSFSEVVMLDGSLSLLRQARERTGGHLTYIAADVLHMPLKAAAVDAALMVRVIQHLPDAAASLAELRRVTCGGGSLVMSYCNKRSLSTMLKWVGKDRNHPYHPLRTDTVRAFYGSPFYYLHPHTMDRTMAEAGFRPVRHLGAGKVEEELAAVGRVDRKLWLGKLGSRVLGRLRLSGWLFTEARALGGEPLLPPGPLSTVLQCPACRGDVVAGPGGYTCVECGRSYPLVDGIADFRLSDADPAEEPDCTAAL